MNAQESLENAIHRSDVDALKLLHPSQVSLTDIGHEIANFVYVGYPYMSYDLISYLLEIDINNYIGNIMFYHNVIEYNTVNELDTLERYKLLITSISRSNNDQFSKTDITARIIILYERYNGDLLYKAILRFVVDLFGRSIDIIKILPSSREHNYIRNDVYLYILFSIADDEMLRNMNIIILGVIARDAIENDAPLVILDLILKYLSSSILNSEEYRRNIPKAVIPNNYVSLFENIDV